MVRARKILVVDDVAMFRELGALFLSRSGRVICAESGAEGLEIAQRERPNLVLADLHMPDMDGAALCRAIKNDPQLCETPVLLMIGGDDPRDRARAVRAGADDLLPKPLSRIALVEAVNRFLQYDSVRGLPRVEVTGPVAIAAPDRSASGTLRNLSRDGVFIETDSPLDPWTEVRLSFELPDTATRVEPSAVVIWQRPKNGLPAGIGLRFLELDRRSVEWLEEFVWEQCLTSRSLSQSVAAR
jgi:uncharacterized protein (TIGR02266 family)